MRLHLWETIRDIVFANVIGWLIARHPSVKCRLREPVVSELSEDWSREDVDECVRGPFLRRYRVRLILAIILKLKES